MMNSLCYNIKPCVQVIGFGPAALGIPVAADRLAMFSQFMREGVLFLEQSPTMKALFERRFPYDIYSNSMSAHFLESIKREGIFAPVFESANTRALLEQKNQPVPLSAVRVLMNELTTCFMSANRSFSASDIVLGQKITTIRKESTNTYTTYNEAGERIANSPFVVLAIGAEEQITLRSTSSPFYKKTMTSEDILCGRHEVLAPSIEKGEPVLLVGGAHSAFSCADVLIRHYGERLSPGQIRIYATRVKLYYPSVIAANKDQYQLVGAETDVETGEINRFTGLRGKAFQLYKQIINGQEKRVSLHLGRTKPEIKALCEHSTAFIAQCTGYQPRPFRFYDAHWNEIKLCRKRNLDVNAHCQLMCENSETLEGVYCLGLGHARREGNRGPFKVGINLFHGKDSETVLHHLTHVRQQAKKLVHQ